MGRRLVRELFAAALLLLFGYPAAAHPAPTKVQVADGVFLFLTPPCGDVGLDGNAVAILSPDGVLVFDSNGTPAAAAAVLAEIRKLTDQPVRLRICPRSSGGSRRTASSSIRSGAFTTRWPP